MKSKFVLFMLVFALLSSTLQAQNVGIGTTSPGTKLDVNGGLATRITTATFTSGGTITVGNSSHIILNSGSSTNASFPFTLSAGQSGQYLVLEMTAAKYAQLLNNTGIVKLATDADFTPFSTLQLKWDGTYWIEIGRNSNTLSYIPNTLTPPTTTYTGSSFNGKQALSYTGSNQTFIVPAGITQIFIKAWAGGGGSGYYGSGGTGAFISGYLAVSPGQTLTVVIGGGGGGGSNTAATSASGGFGGGGAGGTSTGTYGTAGGGGRSAIITQSVEIATAGGGGGGGGYGYTYYPNGGTGGQTNAANGAGVDDIGGQNGAAAGKGATTGTGGAGGVGGSITGGTSTTASGGNGANAKYGGGGGGGGYLGGGGGGGANGTSGNTLPKGGGGGGSSYVAGLTTTTSTPGVVANANSPTANAAPNTTDVDYISPVATGAYENYNYNYAAGGNGLVVIYW